MPEQSAALYAGAPETSESEEMYLLTVAVAEEDGNDGPFGLASLGESLGIAPASVNEMVRKLESRALLTYQPYLGVELTEEGRRVAQRVLRTRRLWSRFLADHLDFTPQGADALACHLEHVTPPAAAERLAAYLGDPDTGPLGRPIPVVEARAALPAGTPLADSTAGTRVEVAATTADEATAQFLAGAGIVSGATITVLGATPASVLVEAGGHRIGLATDVAASVLVRELETR